MGAFRCVAFLACVPAKASSGIAKKGVSKEDKMAEFGKELAIKLMLLATPEFRCKEGDLASRHINMLVGAITEDPKAVVSNMLSATTLRWLHTRPML